MISVKDLTEEQLRDAVDGTWFELDDSYREDGTLMLETRENGSVGDEEFSPIDFTEAVRIVQLLKKAFPDQIFTGDTCDEWVIITIKDRN